jgi:hypothetical protein
MEAMLYYCQIPLTLISILNDVNLEKALAYHHVFQAFCLL